MSVKVKICGVSRPDDVRAAVRAGAHALGLNFVPESVRYIGGIETARVLLAECAEVRSALQWAGVFVNPTREELDAAAETLKLDILQLHGEETPEFVADARARWRGRAQIWKAFRVATAEDLAATARFDCDGWVIDAKVAGMRGGSGKTFDWSLLAGLNRRAPLILGGGLNPRNVAEGIRAVRPDWVDTASGVEVAPGVKDAALMQSFVDAARG